MDIRDLAPSEAYKEKACVVPFEIENPENGDEKDSRRMYISAFMLHGDDRLIMKADDGSKVAIAVKFVREVNGKKYFTLSPEEAK